jgi:hypothetical protein
LISQTEILRYLNIQIGSWVTATKYKVGQYISEGGVIYECIIEHTSAATFAADLTALKWTADTFVLQCMNQAISDVNSMGNRDFRYASYTDKFQGDGYSEHWLKNPPLAAVTSIKYFDEDTATYLTIFSGSDTVSNSAQLLSGKLRLFNGYSFESTKQYEVVYTGGYVSNTQWVTGLAYSEGNSVVNNGNKYICLIAHTAGTFATDLAADKWELSTLDYVPAVIKQVTLERAAWNYKSGFPGGGRLALASENVGGQSSDGKSFDVAGMDLRHNKVLSSYRLQNI